MAPITKKRICFWISWGFLWSSWYSSKLIRFVAIPLLCETVQLAQDLPSRTRWTGLTNTRIFTLLVIAFMKTRLGLGPAEWFTKNRILDTIAVTLKSFMELPVFNEPTDATSQRTPVIMNLILWQLTIVYKDSLMTKNTLSFLLFDKIIT